MNRERAPKETSLQETEVAPCVEIDLASSDEKKCLRILLVDDDLGFLEVSKQILSMEDNFKIDTATSVDEAFEKMEKQTYDAVVSDYEMPLKNGLDFLKQLKERKAEISFILFTGKGREEVVVKALNLGADRYINKLGSPETVYCELADAIKKTVERKKSKQLLVESELKYRTVVEKSLQGVLITLVDPLRLVFANAAMARILGYSVEELLSLSPQGIMELIFQEDRTVFFERMQSRFHGEPAEGSLEFRAVRKDNSIVWLEAFSNRIDYEGQSAVLGMFLDIDERKKADCALRESEDRYRELANSLPDIVFEADANGKLVFVNERAPEIAGYSREDFEKGMNILEFIVPEDRERAKKNIQRLLAGGNYVPTEYKFLRKNGTTFPALITTVAQISRNKMRGLRGLVIDITERKKAEQALQESEGELRAIFDGASDGILAADIKTKRFVFANPEMCKLTGYSLEELLKLSVNDIHPEKDLTYVNDQFTKQLQGKYTLSVDIPILRKDKKVVCCDVNARRAKIAGQDCLIGLFRDITERKKAEEQLRENGDRIEEMNEKLRVVGSLTRHDVQNKLSAITAYSYILKKKHADQADIIEGLCIMERAVKEVEKIFDFARAYEQLGVEKLVYTDAEKTVNEAAQMFSGLTFQVVNDCHGLTLLADSFLRQLFYNLIDNTRKYGEKAKTIRVHYEKAGPNSLRLIYEDDGAGISSEDKQNLFKQGFSTGASAGYGLYLIKKMIDVYGWEIEENGEAGKGAKFVITIPKTNKNGQTNYQIQRTE